MPTNDSHPEIGLARAARLLRDWWAEMGVDEPFEEEPAAEPEARPRAEVAPPHDPPPPAIRVAAKNLGDLREEIAAAEGCALKESARNAVFARGNPRSGIMLIGEAPGRDEDIGGEPFIGRAGQLLDRMFRASGRDPKTGVYITNLLPWRPPSNRDPTPGEVAFCLPFLLRHIELVGPRLLIAAGRFSTHTLLETKEALTRLRGQERVYRHDGFGPVPCIPIMHPAYLLRRPGEKARAWRDMLTIARIARRLGLPESPLSQ